MVLTRGGLGSPEEIQLCKDYEVWALKHGAGSTPEVDEENEKAASVSKRSFQLAAS
jgi:hypothetical protein